VEGHSVIQNLYARGDGVQKKSSKKGKSVTRY
jgi:hypothetical protein